MCPIPLDIHCKIHIVHISSQIARFVRPTWGPSGADRTQVGPMLVPWTLLPGMIRVKCIRWVIAIHILIPCVSWFWAYRWIGAAIYMAQSIKMKPSELYICFATLSCISISQGCVYIIWCQLYNQCWFIIQKHHQSMFMEIYSTFKSFYHQNNLKTNDSDSLPSHSR